MDSNFSRRSFMALCGAAAVPVVAGAALPCWGAANRRSIALEEMTLETFKPLVGDDFQVTVAGKAPVTLRLADAQAMQDRYARSEDGQPLLEGFSLRMEGSREKPVPQGLHEITHPAIGTSALFLVPVVSRDPQVCSYEIIFNRVLPR